MFGVDIKTINDIWAARTWKWVTQDMWPNAGAEVDAIIHGWSAVAVPDALKAETRRFVAYFADRRRWPVYLSKLPYRGTLCI